MTCEMTIVDPADGSRRLRVLSIAGGGMRGLYASTYLSALAKQAAARRNTGALDIGKAFDLIVGTSTGGIMACALAAGIPLDDVTDLYRWHGKAIFPVKMPAGLGVDLILQLFSRRKHLRNGSESLKRVLEEKFQDLTIRNVYDRRGIALAIPAVEMSRHRGWVFKTPHLNGHRDSGFRLVDVCLATSAAPLYRSMARVENPTDQGHHHVFVDGGLWANNPILVAMIDALRMTKPGDRIEIFSLGTCPRPAGDILGPDDMHRDFSQWKFGTEAAAVSFDAQDFAYGHMAAMLTGHIKRECKIVSFPRGDLPAATMPYLDLDETSDKGLDVLVEQAHEDVSLTLSACDRADDGEGQLLAALLNDLPVVQKQEASV